MQGQTNKKKKKLIVYPFLQTNADESDSEQQILKQIVVRIEGFYHHLHIVTPVKLETGPLN